MKLTTELGGDGDPIPIIRGQVYVFCHWADEIEARVLDYDEETEIYTVVTVPDFADETPVKGTIKGWLLNAVYPSEVAREGENSS